jgi:hypothetical protein
MSEIEQHWTQKGRIVYNRKPNYFKVRNINRIIEHLIERFDSGTFQQPNFEAFTEVSETISLATDLLHRVAIVTIAQETLFQIFIKILSGFLPEWAIEVIEWVYENIDAGKPPWYDEYVK